MVAALAVGAAAIALAVPVAASSSSSKDYTWGFESAPYSWVTFTERNEPFEYNQQYTPSHAQEDQVYFGFIPDVPEVLPCYLAVKLSDIDYEGSIPEIDINYSPSHGDGTGFSSTLSPEQCYLVLLARDENNHAVTDVKPVLCYYFELVGPSRGYYPVASKENKGCCITIPVNEFSLAVPLDFSSPIAFLYSLGDFLCNNVVNVGNLFSFTIFGHSFFEILMTTGFFVYMGWCIVKWAIPV